MSANTTFAVRHPQYLSFFILLASTFFMWGFLTCNNTVILPHVMNVLQVSYTKAQMLNFSFFVTYFVTAVPFGKLVNKVGYKNSMIVGLLIAGYACTLFGPASTIRSYPMFLAAMVVMACGITLLQVSANPYVTLLSFRNTASSRLTLQQGFNALGAALAPIMGHLVYSLSNFTPEGMAHLSPEQYRSAETEIVQVPYMGLATILFLMAFALFFSKLPDIHTHHAEPSIKKDKNRLKYVLQFPHLYLGVLAIFLYVGAEMCIGVFLSNVLVHEEFGGIDFDDAPKYVAVYWAGIMVGRFIGAVILPKVDTGKAIALCSILSTVLIIIFMYASGMFALISLLAVGLTNAILFPCIFALGIDGLGKFSEEGSSLLIWGIFGGAIIPLLMGYSIEFIGLQKAFIIPALCYVFIIYYGLKGSKIDK